MVQAAAPHGMAFQAALTLRQRPLMIVVPWPDDSISEDDHRLVRDLALHLAGAFLASSGGTSRPD
jgi:hypothetical protein